MSGGQDLKKGEAEGREGKGEGGEDPFPIFFFCTQDFFAVFLIFPLLGFSS